MNSKKLKIIISILASSILGILVLQGYWLQKSIETQQKTFDQNVNHVLRLVSDNIEINEYVAIMNLVSNKGELIKEFSELEELKDSLDIKHARINYDFQFRSKDSINHFFGKDSFRVQINSDETEMKIVKSGIKKGLNYVKSKEAELVKRSNDLEKELFLDESEDVQIHAFTFDSVEIVKMYSSESDSGRSVYLRKKAVLDAVFNPVLKNRNIETNKVDSLLNLYLNDQGIDINFAFAIKEKDLITGSKAYKVVNNTGTDIEFTNSVYSVSLFPEENRYKENTLEVVFPDQMSFIWWNALPALVLSLFFIAIVISIFVMVIRNLMKQKKLSEMKNDFINNMTHELKTPISTIALASEGIRKNINGTNSKVTQFADIIYDENRRLAKQVEKILQISQIEKDQFELDKSHFDLHQILEEIIASYQVHVDEEKAFFKLELDSQHSEIYADIVHFKNVVNNLIDNAIKYCNGKAEITIETKNVDSKIYLSVSDKGIGIPEESLDYIYEKFYRVPKGDIHDVKGFGLGLTYVKNIVDSHGFEIDVWSKVAKGTRFTIAIDLNAEKNLKEIADESSHIDG